MAGAALSATILIPPPIPPREFARKGVSAGSNSLTYTRIYADDTNNQTGDLQCEHATAIAGRAISCDWFAFKEAMVQD